MRCRATGRRSVVISGAGDRRDEDLIEQTKILGAAFDDAILYQDQAQRGRADGEVIALLRHGLERCAPHAPDRCRSTASSQRSNLALERLAPGDSVPGARRSGAGGARISG